MKRWIAAAIFSALCGMLLCACNLSVSDSEGPAKQSSDTDSVRQDGNGEDIAGVTLEDQLAWSDSILEARFVYEEDHGTYQLYYFEPVDQLRGRIDGPQFAVRYVCRAVELTESGPRGERAPYGFKAGREYLLILERFVSVTQPEDYYYIVGNLQYEKPDAAATGWIRIRLCGAKSWRLRREFLCSRRPTRERRISNPTTRRRLPQARIMS